MTNQAARLAILIAAMGILMISCAKSEHPAMPEFSDGSGGRRPNILVVLVDVLRRDHLGTYGYGRATSPNIDSFAERSFRFDRAYSHSSWTKPSVATLFTSVYPEQHGLGRVGFMDGDGFQTDVLPKRLATMAERLRKNGYQTGAFSTNVHIERKTGFAQGFDHFFWKRLVVAFELNLLLEEWIEGRDEDKPFFAYLHYMDVHWPYDQRLDPEVERFGNTVADPPAPKHWTLVPHWAENNLDENSLAAIVASYDEEVAYIDQAFGELVGWLEENGVLDDTIVVFVADHGEGFNEHGELQHGFAPYEEVTGVPLLIRLPPAYKVEPRPIQTLVGLVDVMPTVLDLVDVDVPRRAQGRSVVPLFLGQGLRERAVFLESAGYRGLRGDTHTVLVDAEGSSVCFDSSEDPFELSPLAEPRPAQCDVLDSTLASLVAQFELLSDSDEPNATVTLDEEEVEALRALGYLD
jgi:arylsulfatase A-like enzyme